MTMKQGLHLQQKLLQTMRLSQQMLQNLELLQMPVLELREKIMEELESNPTIEERQEEPEPVASTDLDAPDPKEEEKRETLEAFEEQLFESERRTRRGDSAEESERRMEMMNNASVTAKSLQEHLFEQLTLMEIAPDMRAYCEHIIQNIDDSGRLKFTVEEISNSLPDELKNEPTELILRKLEKALQLIQTLEPRGVGARSTRECLLLQIDDADPLAPLLRKLIENNFEDMGNNRFPKIVKDFVSDPDTMALLGYGKEPDPSAVMEDVKDLVQKISKLNPRPGADYTKEKVPKVYPEVAIKQIDGKYEIQLEDSYLPSISISPNYADLAKDKNVERVKELRAAIEDFSSKLEALQKEGKAESGEAKELTARRDRAETDMRRLREDREFIKRKLDAGRKLITAIEQRRSTIQRITAELLKRQMDFFEQGMEHLKPLKMQEIADAVGIHVSTVSRAISDKWIETPRGIFPMKFFFASAAPKAEVKPGAFGTYAPIVDPADQQTRLSLMEKMREILDSENPKNPLSDLDIARILKDKHSMVVARRTIAKYREEMGILSSRLRKQY